MPWSVYSSEDFPKWDSENGCQCDYLQALGVQVILRAGKWTHLEDFYKHVRYESWVDAAGDGRESITTGQQVAERLHGDFRLRGVRCANLDKITDSEREAIEVDSKQVNLKLRRMFVDRFEQQFRTKMQGGPGRWLPNPYEAECYQLLGLKPPDTVQKQTEERVAQPAVVIKESVDQELLAQLVAAEVARITAPSQKR